MGTTANKIVQLDGTSRLPAVDGSQLINLNASSISVGILPLNRITPGTAGDVLTTVAGVPTWQAPVTGVTTLDGLTDAIVAAPASGQILVNDGAGQFRNVTMSGDAAVSNTGVLTIANSAISGGVGGKITDGTITTADMAPGAVTGGLGGIIVDATVTNADISTTAAIAVTKVAAGINGDVLTTVAGVPTWQAPAASADAQDLTLAGSTLSLVNDPTPVVLGGLSILNSVSSAEITDATIINGDISPAAAIAVTKVASGANGDVLTTVAGIPTWQAPAASADAQDLTLAGTTLSLVNDPTPVVLGGLSILNTVTSTEITDAAIINADISPAAAIAVTKVAAGVNGDVLTTVAGVPTWQAIVTGATALDGLTDATVAAPASGQILVNDGAGQFRNVNMSGDATITNTGALTIANGAISGGVGGKITDGTIAAADLAAGSVSGGAGGVITDATVTNADISVTAAIAVTKVASGVNGDVLTTVAGVPTWQAPVTGATTLDGLTDATVAAPASGQILVNNGAGQFVNVSMSGDATISNTGVLTIANGAISGGVGGKVTDGTIAAADLAASSVSGGAAGIIADGTITTADILDGTIASADITDGTVTNIDIGGAAAIAVTKVAAGTNGHVLTTVAGIPTWAAPAGGFSTLNTVPKGNGTTLVDSNIYDVGGLIGINNSGPAHNLDVFGSLYSSGADSYFNQTLDNSEGNMGVGGTAYTDIKLNVDSDQAYGIWVTNTSPGGYSAYLEGDVVVNGYIDVTGNAFVNGYLDVVGDAYVAGDTYLTGNLDVGGALSKGSGTFKIDHPLDPQNKILYHSFVESPDMMNVYNGNVVTDGQGEVTVTLPDYFEALNKDFRYQLTAIGTFAQAIVYRKIANNRFVIKTDKPNVEVSWQVTGIRKDPYAEKNRVVPEVAKTGDQRGKYLYPEAYGISSKAGNSAQRKPPVKKKPVLQKADMAKSTTQKKPVQKP